MVPFEVLEKVNPNAYKIDLLGDYGVSAGEDDGDHPTLKTKAVLVQESSKEVEFLRGYLERTPAGPTRNWPHFVTLVS